MLQGGHSAKISTFIKLPSVVKIFVVSIFELPLQTGFTVLIKENIGLSSMCYRRKGYKKGYHFPHCISIIENSEFNSNKNVDHGPSFSLGPEHCSSVDR